jgi:hypothetical protein
MAVPPILRRGGAAIKRPRGIADLADSASRQLVLQERLGPRPAELKRVVVALAREDDVLQIVA